MVEQYLFFLLEKKSNKDEFTESYVIAWSLFPRLLLDKEVIIS